ncbi:MAG: toxin [Desulfobacterales bacterium]|nr:MAG: toxin [Desulfobacterales bacterium]
MDYYRWNHEKNRKLKEERGIGFEQVVIHIERGGLLDVLNHPNRERYPNQQLLVVEVNDYAYLVPFVEDENGRFLKTIIPSRKATRYYLGGEKNEEDQT